MLLFIVAQGFYICALPEATRSRRRAAAVDQAAAGRDEAGSSVTAADIEAALRAALAPTALEVDDDSHLHAGHAGAREGRHFSVRIASAALQRPARRWPGIASYMMPCTP